MDFDVRRLPESGEPKVRGSCPHLAPAVMMQDIENGGKCERCTVWLHWLKCADDTGPEAFDEPYLSGGAKQWKKFIELPGMVASEVMAYVAALVRPAEVSGKRKRK